MSHQIDFQPVATAAGANVDTQAAFQGSGYQQNGFQVGIAQPQQFNKIARQASMMAAALANFISNELNMDVLDDGNLAVLITNLTNAIMQAAENGRNRVVNVPYSATPVFDASLGDTFVIVLTGDVTSSTLINVAPGQNLRFLVRQDGVGGHAFAPPAGVEMAAINTAAGFANLQRFFVDSGSNVYVDGPLVGQ